MNIKCPKCRFKLDVTAPPEGGAIECVCPRCGNKFTHEFPVQDPPPSKQEPIKTLQTVPEEANLKPENIAEVTPVQQEAASPEPSMEYVYDESDTGKSKTVLWIILGVLAIAAIATGIILWPSLYTTQQSEEIVFEDTTAVVEEIPSTVDSEETIKNEIESVWGSNEALSPEFQALIKKDEALSSAEGAIMCLDWDVWTQSQEGVQNHHVVQVTDITETTATAYVRRTDFTGNSSTTKLLLIKLNGQWRVDEIIHNGYYEKKQLEQCLKEVKNSSHHAPAEATTTIKVYVDGVNVRLRTSPEISDYNVITDGYGKNLHPNKGDKLEYLGESGDFYYISFRGINAYISKQFSYLVYE